MNPELSITPVSWAAELCGPPARSLWTMVGYARSPRRQVITGPHLGAVRQFAVEFLPIPDDAVIRPDIRDKTGPDGLIHYHRCGEYRRKGPAAPLLNDEVIKSVVPRWADISSQLDFAPKAPKRGYVNS